MTLDVELLSLLNGLVEKSQLFSAPAVFCFVLAVRFIAAFFLPLPLAVFPAGEGFPFLENRRFNGSRSPRHHRDDSFFYHRPRPFLTHQMQPLLSENSWSFPSGHAAPFFALAAAVFLANKKWGTVFFAGVILMGIGRVAAGVHYPKNRWRVKNFLRRGFRAP